MLEMQGLAVSSNSSAGVDLSRFGDFKQKLLNASSTLSRVNDTLRRTSDLLSDSSKAGEFAAPLLFRNATACRKSLTLF